MSHELQIITSLLESNCNSAVSSQSSLKAHRPSEIEYPGVKTESFSPITTLYASPPHIYQSETNQLPLTRLCSVHKDMLPRDVQKKKPFTKIPCPDQHKRYSSSPSSLARYTLTVNKCFLSPSLESNKASLLPLLCVCLRSWSPRPLV